MKLHGNCRSCSELNTHIYETTIMSWCIHSKDFNIVREFICYFQLAMHIYGLDHKYKYSYLQHLNIKSMMTPSANVRSNHYITSTNVIGNHYITSTNVIGNHYITSTNVIGNHYITSTNVIGNHYITSTNVIGNHYITSTNVCIIWHCCKALTLYFCKIGKSILFSLKNVLISFLHTGTHKYYV